MTTKKEKKMIRKFVLTSFMVLFVIMKMANAFAFYELGVYGDSATFCQYQGMLGDLAEVDKEFKMLLEPPNYPNFQSMYTTISQLLKQVHMSEKHLEVLRNPECNVSKYASALLVYYEDNKAKIRENIKNFGPDRDIARVLESFKKELGIKFFSSIILDRQRVRLNTVCKSYAQDIKKTKRKGYFDGVRSFNCQGGVMFTLMELIDMVQMLTEEVDQLKQRLGKPYTSQE